MRFWIPSAAFLALAACGGSEPTQSTSRSEPSVGIVFSAEDAERLKTRIDDDPDQAALLLEQVVASSVASLTDEQFVEFRDVLLELLNEGRLQRLIRAGREHPATSDEVPASWVTSKPGTTPSCGARTTGTTATSATCVRS